MKKSYLAILLATVLVLLCAFPALAQSNTAKLTGTVADAQGAVVPGVSITVTSSKGRATTVQSNASGFYTIAALDPDTYNVDVKQSGFKPITQKITLQTAQQAELNFTMQLGSTSETVEVTSDVPLVDAISSNVSAVIVGRQITELPLNGNNFTQLATLVPGVTRGMPANQQSGEGNQAETFRYAGNGGSAISVNGLRQQANNFLLDGFDNNESLVNTIVFFPPTEAIQEFRVDTSVAPAEFGRAGGGIVNSSIKSGTNSWHGSAFDYLRNSVLDAKTYALGPNDPKPPFRRNQFGGAIGGAIIKNKLFIFGDYQGLRQAQPASLDFATVPTDMMRSGDFSELLGLQRVDGTAVAPIQIRHAGANSSADYVNYVGNIIPSADFVGAGQAYLNAYPEPNVSATNTHCGLVSTLDGLCLQQNYMVQRQQIQNFDDFDIRADYVLRTQDTMFLRYSYGHETDVTTSRLPALPAGFGSGDQFSMPRSWAFGETHTFSPNILNEFRFGWIRANLGYLPPFDDQALSANLGIPNANTSSLLGGGALIGGYNGQLEYTGDYGPYQVPENTYQLADNVSWIKGHHSFKFGANLMWRQVNLFRPKAGKGYFFISGNGGDAFSTGYEVSDVLAGFMNNYQVGPALGFAGTRSWENGIFAQDDWRITNRLTLNLGFRWDVLTWPTEVHNQMSNFDLNPGSGTYGQVVLPGTHGYNDSFVPTDWHNFAPRVGFAYNLFGNGKSVVRGGYGMFYFVDRGGIDNQMAQNAPFAGVSQYNYTNGYRFTLGGQAPLNSVDPTQGGAVGMPDKNDFNIDFTNPANLSMVSYLNRNVPASVQEWNLQFEQELGVNTSFMLAYVGNKGTHLTSYHDFNRQFYNQANGDKNFPAMGSLTVHDTSGNSNYNSLQAQLTRRMTKGLQFNASYTWAHAIDDSQGAFDANNGVVDYFNLAHERANSLLDFRQRFVFNALYELPFGHGRQWGNSWNGVTNAVLGGWQFNPILTLSSGSPFDLGGIGNPQTRPDLVGQLHQLNSVNGMWFDTSAFAVPASNGTGVFLAPGTAPRNPFTGPGTEIFDFSVQKTFAITERVRTEFTSQFFNAFNTPQFAQPDGNFYDGNFGRVTNTRLNSERQVQFGLRVLF
ncbi:TonB-dependent receptor [Candidatus Koribacter versatilis Ellin345]|uniref:TonB-dependent receptor n=1 Tax=Koribacter versatilis (strain Ellin345) TaxID=204669 RepID=Q1IRJ7_KORVE|nr:TonB-dependent receptor [Candidatus Koribacter versatilis]ABF40503.1 TonB-dependent receptor [Candidatus Koribacter versatilis Ellin345]